MTVFIHDFSAVPAALDIDLGGLPSSSDLKTGRQTAMVDNTVFGFPAVKVFGNIMLGTNPSGDSSAAAYILQGDLAASSPYRTEGAAAIKGDLSVLEIPQIGCVRPVTAPVTADIVYIEFTIINPGREWGVMITHNTGVNLDAANSNHYLRYIGLKIKTA